MTCPKCGATCGASDAFCKCGERLTVTADANAVRDMISELARVRTDVFARIEALEVAGDQASLSRQRAALNLGGVVSERVASGDLRALERSAAGFSSFGEFVSTIAANPADGRLQSLNTRALATLPGSAGGFLIPNAWSDVLLDAVNYASIVRPYARFAPRSEEHPDAAIDLPMLDTTTNPFGGIAVSWIGEGSAKPESQPVFRSLGLKPNEVAGYCELTDKLLRNVPGVSTYLAGLFVSAIAATMDFAYLFGNGVAQPLGVFGHASMINVARAGANTVTYPDLVAMIAASRGTRKRWIISQSVIGQIALATLPGGLTPLWQPNANGWGSMLGFPIDVFEASPVLGQPGDVMLVDWNAGYVIADGKGLTTDMTNAHGTNFIQNRSVLKAFAATDGQPMLTGPITLADGVTQVSPFVCLV
jgi:HK97 family phage major capsid protein